MESGGLFELLFEIAMVLIGGWIALGAVSERGSVSQFNDDLFGDNWLADDADPILGVTDIGGNIYNGASPYTTDHDDD